MKTKLKNIALEGTGCGDVVGGLLSWAGEKPSGAFVLKGGLNIGEGDSKRTGCPERRILVGNSHHNGQP